VRRCPFRRARGRCVCGRTVRRTPPLDEKSPLWADIRIVGSDGKLAKELPLKDGYFEVALPQAFFEGNPTALDRLLPTLTQPKSALPELVWPVGQWHPW
jgi:hypothetical protein